MIISLYKGKGLRNECASYRPITLLSLPGKVFAHVLLSRIDPLLRSKRRFEQSGFTSWRSTLDAILALRLLSEVHREFSQPLHVAFVDLKAAFDSVDRLALWKALRGIGIPQYLLQLIEDLYNGSTSSVRIGTTLSPSFITSSGVRQGCVLAPALFCRAMTGLWSELPPELVSHWAMTTSLTWIMLMTLSSSLTKWMTFIVPWRFLRQQRRNSAYVYLGRRRRSRIWVRVNLHLAYQFAATRWKK